MAKSTTLRAKNTNEILYPQTKAEVVYTLDGGDVETKLQNITSALSELESARDYKGYYPSEASLLSRYPNDIANPHDREGWYARVGDVGTSDTTMYYWDVEDNAWVRGATVEVTGASSVNGIQPDEQGNVLITAEDIPTGYTNQDGSNKNVQEVFNMLQSEHLDLESEIEAVNGKATVLYLTNEEMEEAVSPSQLLSRYEDGQVVVCNDEGNYKLGSSYKYIAIETEGNPVNAWEEITSSGGTEDIISKSITLFKDVEIQTVSYFDITENKFNLIDDYYVSDNKNSYSSAIMAIQFNLEEPKSVSFEAEVSNCTQSNETLYFSELDKALEDSYGSSTNVKTKIPYNTTGVTTINYDLPEGTHIIYVRFCKYYTQNAVGKFKIATDLSGITEKTLNNTLETNDLGYLTANGNAVLTESNAMIIAKGEVLNPVIIDELEQNKMYILSGYFKLTKSSTKIGVVTETESGTIVPSSSVILFVGKYSSSFGTPITIFGGTLTSQKNILLSDFYKSSSGIAYCGSIDSNGSVQGNDLQIRYQFETLSGNRYGTLMTTDNATEFVPKGKYNPATKDYADNVYYNAVENPSLVTDEKYINKFLTTSDISSVSDNHLYFMHKMYGEPEYKSITIGSDYKYDTIYLNKDVLSLTFPNNTNSTINIVGRATSSTSSSSNQFVVEFKTGASGEITRIKFAYGYSSADEVTAYENGVWNTNEMSPNTTHCKQIYFSDTWTPNNKLINPYFTYVTRSYTTEVKKLANYDDITNGGGGGSTPSAGGMNYLGEYESTTVYSKDDVVHYNNHFFICLGNNTVDVTPNIDMFYTEEGGVTYWRNMGYSATYADRAIADGDGNNIANTYATKDEVISTLPSEVRIWGLADGIYKLPADATIYYYGATNTSSKFKLGTGVTGTLIVSTGNNDSKFWTIDADYVSAVYGKITGRTTSDKGFYNKFYFGSLLTNITSPRAVPLCNDLQNMTASSNFWLMGTPDQNAFTNVQHSGACYINNNELYSNNSKVATQNDLGTQVTYSLSGTVLTITDK